MPSPAGIPPASPSGIGATSDVRCVGSGVGDMAVGDINLTLLPSWQWAML